MKTTANKKYENTLQNAKNYLKQEGQRKAPNNRIKGKSFFQIKSLFRATTAPIVAACRQAAMKPGGCPISLISFREATMLMKLPPPFNQTPILKSGGFKNFCRNSRKDRTGKKI